MFQKISALFVGLLYTGVLALLTYVNWPNIIALFIK